MRNRIARTLTLIALAVGSLSPLCRAQAQLVGEWLGTAKTGDTQLHIAWHVTAAKDGGITSTIDNLDQRIFGLPVSSITVKDNTLTLTLDTVRVLDGDTINIHGSFTGIINSDATEIRGSWVQGQTLELDLKRVSLQDASNAVAESQLAGDWQGTLSAGGAELRLVLHMGAARDGSLTATLDSVDQGAYGIPVSAISVNGTAFKMTVDAVHGTYTGTVNKDASEIDGTWSQGQPIDLNFHRSATPLPPPAPPKPAAPTDIDGSWTGVMNTGATELHLIFKVVNTADGLMAQMQSPDQSPVWIPASSVTRVGATVIIKLQGLAITFEGTISGDLGSIDGSFTQGNVKFPLLLKREKN
ncbi:MAG: hypothetical protein ACLPLZ_01060 [Terracidiphilus sp.]